MNSNAEQLTNMIKKLNFKNKIIAEVIILAFMAKSGNDDIHISRAREQSLDGTGKLVYRIEVPE